MGGPKINKSHKISKNRIGRMANKAKQRGGGKALRKKKHRMKKAKNIEKKLLRYYGEVWKGNIDATKEKENEEAARGRRLNLSGKKLRKLRKRSQSRPRIDGGMEVEISQKTDDSKANDKDNKTEKKEQSAENNDEDSWEDVEMQDGSDEEADEDKEEA